MTQSGHLIQQLFSEWIVLFRAEFTQVWADQYGNKIFPADNAEFVTTEKRNQEGLKRDASQTHALATMSGFESSPDASELPTTLTNRIVA